LRNTAVRIGIVAFGVLVAGAAYWAAHRPPEPPEITRARISVARDIAEKAVANMGSAPRWSSIAIDDAKPSAYRLTIHYAAPPEPAQVETDTKALGRAMLLQLTLAGHHAADEQTDIVVHAITGDNPAVLGTARFVPAEDRIVFAGGG
jgi:hypothetical protein